jgi:hypothetical protein
MTKQSKAAIIVFGACLYNLLFGYAFATHFAKKRMDKMVQAHKLEITKTEAEWHSKGFEAGWNEVAGWDAIAVERGLPIKKPYGKN